MSSSQRVAQSAAVLVCALAIGNVCRAQTPPPDSAPSTGTPILAKVIEVHGDVKHAPIDSSEWSPCKLDDQYPPQTKLLTGIRSSIKLQIGDEEPYTVMVVESVGLSVISEASRDQDTKRVRIGVAHGRVKAGVAEGGLKSDFTVDSPVATLSKRGTWGFSLFYERATDAFEIALADRGLVEALNRLTNKSRSISPGEYITEAMRAWMDEVQFQNVAIPDILGQGELDVAYNRLDQDGLGVTNPGSGRTVLINLSNASFRNQFSNLVRQNLTPTPSVIVPPPGDITALVRPEGFFGTGRGDQLIPILIDAQSPLAQRGAAKPGRYLFRRSALEGWLQRQNNP